MPDAAAALAPASPLPLSLPPRGTLLGFDFGLARTGVAIGELETGHASALITLHEEANAARFAAITRLIDEWRPVALIVGLPRYLDGGEHPLTVRCQRFANQLHGRFNLPVTTVDERLSSAAADAALREAGVRDWRQRRDKLDASAAQLILQHFLDSTRHAIPD